MRVLTVFGTRPEAIKMAPVVKALEADSRYESRVCVTSQHREMLDQVLALFGVEPHWDLDVMKPGQDLFHVTSAVLTGLQTVLEREEPDVVLVHGDTTTTFAAALAAFYSNCPVGHVEAGLRTGTLEAPFPEEANRLLTDRLATYYFCPTERNRRNLVNEGVPADNVACTGNTVIDALMVARDSIQEWSPETWEREAGIELSSVLRDESRFILVTGHRRENFGQGLEAVCEALLDISNAFPDTHIVYPAHLNPNVQRPVRSLLAEPDNIHIIDPVEYRPFVYLMHHSSMIITDSGGIQEEAPSLGKPVLVTREATERPEAIETGIAFLVGTSREAIFEQTRRLLTSKEDYETLVSKRNPFGDGKASRRILDTLFVMSGFSAADTYEAVEFK